LLLIGDAAHVMSSVGGVGIQCAIQDAVVAAAVLQGPLLKGTVDSTDLAAVQRRREWPTRLTQAIQAIGQRQVIARALDPDRAFSVPVSLRLPLVRDLATRFTAFGVWPVHVRA
jgi:2-polyprenyl-6-methoxyphenol hydroxylase-like FAD-dependent oxidoreductase